MHFVEIDKPSMSFIKEEEEDDDGQLCSVRGDLKHREVEPSSPRMYLATGLGLDDADFGDSSISTLELGLSNFEDSSDETEYYKRMLDNFPCHPLFLRKYGQILQVHSKFIIFLKMILLDYVKFAYFLTHR